MKKFACGDVVPGCDTTFNGSNDDEILAQVAQHAADVHGLTEVPQELIGQVMSRIEIVA